MPDNADYAPNPECVCERCEAYYDDPDAFWDDPVLMALPSHIADYVGDCEECGDLDVQVALVADPSEGKPIAMCADCRGWWLNHSPGVSPIGSKGVSDA